MRTRVETASGRFVELLDPRPETIVIEDIAHALARLARYNGHTLTQGIYSVAEHCRWCSAIAAERLPDLPEVALQALLHDAHEAYTGDIVAPLKRIPELAAILGPIEDGLQAAIHEALGVPPPTATEVAYVQHIDAWALDAEASALMATRGRDWHLPTPCPTQYLGRIQPPTSSAEWEASCFLSRYHTLKEMTHEQ